MLCQKCGSDMGDSKFCPNCSTTAADDVAHQLHSTPKPQNQSHQIISGVEISENSTVSDSSALHPEKPLGMKWYKWLLVVLIIGALANFGDAMKVFTGITYEEQINVPGFTAENLYELCDGLEMWDKMLGAVGFAVAALQIVTRFMLAKYRKFAPMLLYATYAIPAVFNWVYALGASATIPTQSIYFGNHVIFFSPDSVMSSVIVKSVVMIVLLVLNIIYFNKRKHMFCN